MTGKTSDRGLREKLVSEIPKRLERARKAAGYDTLKAFYRAVTEGEPSFSVSYPAVINYHGQGKEREAPVSYLVRVAQITGVRLEWLIKGEGEMLAEPASEAENGCEETLPAFVEPLAQAVAQSLEREPDVWYRLVVLPRKFLNQLPLAEKLRGGVRAMLEELGTQFVTASPEEGAGGIWTEDVDRFAQDVDRLMRFPYERLGFPEDPSSFRYNQYVMSLVQALMVASPRREEEREVTGYPIRTEVPT